MLFAVVVFVVVTGIHWYLWLRLVRDTTLPGRWRRVGTAVLVGLGVLLVATLTGTRVLDPEVGVFLAWPGYLWLALMFYLLLALALIEIPRLVLLRRLRGRAPATPLGPEPAPPTATESPAAEPEHPATVGIGQSRRLFLARSTAVVAGLAATSVVGYGARTALGGPVVQRVAIPLRRLDAASAGMRIAVVSDIHLGPILGRGHTERIVHTINELQPDLVAIVGDLVDGTVEKLGRAAEPLRDLVSTHGSFFVTGNHEYYSGAEPWLRELERLGVHPLRNERTEIRHRGGVLDLAGVNDVTGRQQGDGPDLDRALAGRPDDRPVVLLAHQPVQVADAARRGVDLQLSGHTHGGQLAPFNLLVPLQQPVVAGLAKVDDTWIYVSRGAGFWGPPVRVGAPPDVTLVELERG
ncbi:hypothetical protein LX15_005474 [Streptoalloteichus tenebrarius]|uniref:Calcineurin-like phosphoesterase domain-containing protein n=1 Tax=Streptoalloteichus tenebrarius (strain ATCC 17920 / DSM 40477 / JCM 4838 / CBS 697.72 / NBRC 16177 / NCIMB 11028 / NRRL B-12390 / A12253. 1 / ISP 5477) TaxID=1933 RepID=A0ABT1I1T0_STRSD|nr:metallophosphoesterase [Streptoalloteichus tenebrarius]MCP2261748.1 hypothetical protein [Streptoalloteichus tenebrarius]BFF00803.1 metallophosphoesterase [Streptoalloteichus tenebrarius]